MNRFRLLEPMEKQQFELLTGLAQSAVQKQIDWALEKNYLSETNRTWQITEQGKLFLNELLTEFLPD